MELVLAWLLRVVVVGVFIALGVSAIFDLPQLGLGAIWALVLTPVLRVAFLFVSFIKNQEKYLAIMSALVLLMLTFAFSLGLHV